MLGAGLDVEWSDPVGWLQSATPEQALAAALRLVGMITGYWVLATTSLYALAIKAGNGAPAWIRLVTLPGMRRLVDRTLATALAASLAAAPFPPAPAEEAPPPQVVFDITTEGVPVPHIRFHDDAAPDSASFVPPGADEYAGVVSPTLVVPTPFVASGASPDIPAAAVTGALAAANYTVEHGDNLWLIAERHLRSEVPEPSAEDVAGYWQLVITANRATLRSGDPNLIYPGEVVRLPEQEITP